MLIKLILPQKLMFAGTIFFHSENLVVNISMRKITLDIIKKNESIKYQIFQENNVFYP